MAATMRVFGSREKGLVEEGEVDAEVEGALGEDVELGDASDAVLCKRSHGRACRPGLRIIS